MIKVCGLHVRFLHFDGENINIVNLKAYYSRCWAIRYLWTIYHVMPLLTNISFSFYFGLLDAFQYEEPKYDNLQQYISFLLLFLLLFDPPSPNKNKENNLKGFHSSKFTFDHEPIQISYDWCICHVLFILLSPFKLFCFTWK